MGRDTWQLSSAGAYPVLPVLPPNVGIRLGFSTLGLSCNLSRPANVVAIHRGTNPGAGYNPSRSGRPSLLLPRPRMWVIVERKAAPDFRPRLFRTSPKVVMPRGTCKFVFDITAVFCASRPVLSNLFFLQFVAAPKVDEPRVLGVCAGFAFPFLIAVAVNLTVADP